MLKFKTSMLQCYLVIGSQDLTKGANIFEFVEETLKNGVTAIQYREKGLPLKTPIEKEKIAFGLRKITKKYNVPLIIDDDWQLALKCQADGIHIGQSDIKITELVAFLGQLSSQTPFIGLSVKKIKELPDTAVSAKISYLGSGPVFKTNSKPDAGTEIGIIGIKRLIANTNLPVVAIGGIDNENVNLLKPVAVAGVAVISTITKAQPSKLKNVINSLKIKQYF